MRPRTGRGGFSLIELLIAMVVAGVLGAALARMIVQQSRFLQDRDAFRSAGQSGRAALRSVAAELRMVGSGGLLAATDTSLTVRSPYAFGVVCQNARGGVTASLFPMNSSVYAAAGYSGYAWRAGPGAWTVVSGGRALRAGSFPCLSARITTLTGGLIVQLPRSSAPVGAPVYLFQQLTYRFGPSSEFRGKRALWRDVAATRTREELVAPFRADAKFAFFVGDTLAVQTRVPSPLSLVRGLQLRLIGESEATPTGRRAPVAVDMTTDVLFENRVN